MTEQALIAGIQALGLTLPASAPAAMLAYRDELLRWNRRYNLTAVRDPDEMVTRHLLDSLAVLPHITGDSLIDVGSGAGLPGIPLALARPDLAVTLLDANRKRTRFLQHVLTLLERTDVTVVQERAERYQAPRPSATLICRAFAALPEMLELTGHLLAEGGRILAMKGRHPEAELAELPATWRHRVVRLEVPGLDAQRHLVVLEHNEEPN